MKKTSHHYRVEKKNIDRECPGEDHCQAIQDYLDTMLAEGWELVSVVDGLYIFAATKHGK